MIYARLSTMVTNLPNLKRMHEAESGVKRRLAHIPELDGIRGVAALMVLFHHVFFTSIQHPERWNKFVLAISVMSHAGQYGVDLFFVLSGFLITSLLISERTDPHYYWNFYWKRAIRIFPLYLLALAILFILIPSSWRYVLFSLFFVSNFVQVWHIPGIGPFWTLAIEEQFYLLWPKVVRTMCTHRLKQVSLAVLVIGLILRLTAAFCNHYNYQFTFFHCDGLALGAILACQRQQEDGFPLGRSSPARGVTRWLVFLLASVLAFCPLALDTTSKLGHIVGAFQLTGVSLLCYLFVGFSVRHSGSRLISALRSRSLGFLGLISYCLYIVNSYAVMAYDKLFGPIQLGNMLEYSVRAGVICGTCVLISFIARHTVELPAAKLRRHVIKYSSAARRT